MTTETDLTKEDRKVSVSSEDDKEVQSKCVLEKLSK